MRTSAGGGGETQFQGDRFGFAGGEPHVRDHGLPAALGVLHLKVGRDQASVSLLAGGVEGAAVRPIDPAVEDQDGATIRRGGTEIEIEGVDGGNACGIAREGIGVDVVAVEEGGEEVAAIAIGGMFGVEAMGDSVEPEFREGRTLPLFVGEDLDVAGVIEGDQAEVIEVGDLAEFFGDAELVAAVIGDQ